MARKNVLTRARKKRARELIEQNRLEEARDLYRRICAIDKMDFDAWLRLGVIHGELGSYEEAEACARRVITLRPDYAEGYYNLGGALGLQGKHEEALAALHKSLAINPGNAQTAGAIARIHDRLDEGEKAYRIIRPIVDAGIGDVIVAYVFSKLCMPRGCCNEAIEYILKLIPHTSGVDRIELHFSLGSLYERKGDFDAAFRHYSEANRQKGIFLDHRKHAEEIDGIIGIYSAGFQERLPRSGNESEKPVFIIGMPRSGSTLVEQIVSSHSRIYGAGELMALPEVIRSLCSQPEEEGPYLSKADKLIGKNARAAARQYLERLTEHSGDATRVTDKLPGNFMHLGLIELLFPNAHVIHCMRDPLDTCLSCYFTDFLLGNHFTFSLSDLGAYYNQYRRLMRHWKSVLTVPVLDVQYEELVNNQEQVSRSIIEFLGLEWEEQCLRFHESGRFADTASYDQVRQPMYRSSIGRWKNYERHLGPLIDALERDN